MSHDEHDPTATLDAAETPQPVQPEHAASATSAEDITLSDATAVAADTAAEPTADAAPPEDPVSASTDDETQADSDEDRQPEPERQAPKEVPYDQAFRLTVMYDPQRGEYRARCDELGALDVHAPTREQALRDAEAALEDTIADYGVRGESLPKPFDLDDLECYSGQLEVRISRSLHRDLTHVSRRERQPVDKLVAELIAAGLEFRRTGERPAPREPQNDRRGRRGPDDNRGRPNKGMSRDRYFEVMQDGAAFRDYLRGGGSSGGGPGGGGGRGRGRGPGGRQR